MAGPRPSSTGPAPVARTIAKPEVTPAHSAPTVARRDTSAPEKSPAPPTSHNIVAALKNALNHMGNRRTYVEFGKLAELINQDNVNEVRAFADTLSKPQEKNIVVSLLLGRWA